MTGRIRFGIGLAALTTSLTAGWLVAIAVAPVLAGWRPLVVSSGSMEPSIRRGDVVVISTPPTGTLASGTVIVFFDPSRNGSVVHRVESVTVEGSYLTKGDANSTIDSAPVGRDRVAGVGRLLVPWIGRPLLAWQERDLGSLLLIGAAVALVQWANRWALIEHADPSRSSGSGRHRKKVAPPSPITVGMVISLLVTLTALLASPADGGFVDITPSSANSLTAAVSFGGTTSYYLHNFPTPPVADTNSWPVPALPLDTLSPTATTLYNYDLDRDASPGLVLNRGASDLTETDADKHQLWSLTAASPITLSGNASLVLWSSMKDFDTERRGEVLVALYDCNASGESCTTLATGSLNLSPWNTAATWTSRTVSLGPVNLMVAEGRTLRVKVVVGPNAQDKMWFAYDTTVYPSRLEIAP